MDVTSQARLCDADSDIINLTDPEIALQWIRNDSTKFLLTVIFPAICLIGIVGNLVFLYTILRLKEMRTTVNAFLGHRCTCDVFFLVSIFCWMTAIVSTSPINGHYPVNSSFGCAFYTVSTRVWYMASIAFTTVITMERYFAICLPIKHRMLKGKGRELYLIAIIWVVSVVLTATLIPHFVKFSRYCVLFSATHSGTYIVCSPINIFGNAYGVFFELVSLIVSFMVNI